MQVKNIEGLSKDQLKEMVRQGGKFVIFKYAVSLVVISYRNNSDVYFIRPGEGTAKYHWGHTALSGIMGWWGIPWGPIYTIGALYNNMSGGTNVTLEVSNQLGLNSLEGYNVPSSNTTTTQSTQSGGYNIPGTNSGSAGQNTSQSTNNPQQGGYNIPR